MTSLNRHLWVILIILALPAISFANQFRVTRVIDGDTIIAVSNGKEEKIRLIVIDAPVLSRMKHIPGQPFSLKSKEHLANLVLNKSITIKSYGTDRYGRSLSEVFVNGINMNIEMVRVGLAEVYRGKPESFFKDRCIENGLWQ